MRSIRLDAMATHSPSPRFPRFLPLALVALAALASCAAAAAEKARPPAAPAKADAILTPAQLRACMTQKDKLRSDTDAAVQAKTAIDADKAEIARSGSALETEATTLDRTNAETVNGYNAKVLARDTLIDAYRAKIDAYNKDAEAVMASKDGYAKACENRRYDDRDLNDLQRKK